MEGTSTIEQRHDHRKGVLKRAQIIDGGSVLDCLVENMPPFGARLRFSRPTRLPDAFALRFPDGTSHAARRRWSRGTAVGIAFEGGGPAPEAERRHLVEAVRDAAPAADPAAVLHLLPAAWF